MGQPSQPVILLVINDQTTCRAVSTVLEGMGYSLIVANDGEDGIILANERTPDVIIVDDYLPGMACDEVIRFLRTADPLAEVPIMLLAEADSRETKSQALGAGANELLNKPVDGLEFQARMRTLTRLNRYRLEFSSMERFHWMFGNSADGYLVMNDLGIIRYANDAAQGLLSLAENYSGADFIDLVRAQYIPQPEQAWENWLEEPEPLYLVRPETPTSHAVWMVLDVLDTPRDLEQHRLVRLHNVTERMSIYHDVRKFHTLVAHKLRTPVSVMVSNLGIMKKQLSRMALEDIRDYVQKTIQETDRLVNEVRDVLTYIDAPLALNIGEPIALSELYTILPAVCDALFVEDVLFSMPDDLKTVRLYVTYSTLELVTEELIENSKKFHPSHKPHIEISVGQTEDDFVRIRFADDGVTLSPEQLSWAWLPYFQGEKDFTGELPGMGLGFPLVATLIWQSGGNVRLSNRVPGPGVVVELKIPILRRDEEKPEDGEDLLSRIM
jgi:CheY-like chemotaxis protein/signal transduction histidine kinase